MSSSMYVNRRKGGARNCVDIMRLSSAKQHGDAVSALLTCSSGFQLPDKSEVASVTNTKGQFIL